MKRTDFYYRVEATVKITGNEIARIVDVGSTHYDGVCKQAVLGGGFVRGWVMQFICKHGSPRDMEVSQHAECLKAHGEKTVGINASRRELDTVAKILEMDLVERALGGPAKRLADSVHQTLREINEESRRLNK